MLFKLLQHNLTLSDHFTFCLFYSSLTTTIYHYIHCTFAIQSYWFLVLLFQECFVLLTLYASLQELFQRGTRNRNDCNCAMKKILMMITRVFIIEPLTRKQQNEL